jgi:hypothetical protein
VKTRDLILVAVGLVIGAIAAALAIGGNQANMPAPTAAAVVTMDPAPLVELQATFAAMSPDEFATLQAIMLATPVIRTVNEAASTSDFYLVPFADSQTWLTDDLEVTLEEPLAEALPSIATDVVDSTALTAAMEDKESATYQYLKLAYDTLVSTLPEGFDAPISTCLALESDLFAGTNNLYFYVQVPQEEQKAMKLPTTWTLLDGPLPQSEIWSSDCYEPSDAEAEATPAS